jgi:hypothetical protein
MSLKPRITVEDNYVDGLICAICESPDLNVVHVDKFPDFVSCGNCASAFVVEDEGSWIMYGKVSDDFPETGEFAVRQWTWLDAVRQRAQDERESIHGEPAVEPAPPSSEEAGALAPSEDELLEPVVTASTQVGEEIHPDGDLTPEPEVIEASSPAEVPAPISDDLFPPEAETTQEFLDEITKLEVPFPPPEDTAEPELEKESVDPADRFDELVPDESPPIELVSDDGEGPSFEGLFPEAEEFTIPKDVPLHLDQVTDEAAEDDIAPEVFDEVQLSRLEQVASPSEDVVSESTVEVPASDSLDPDDLFPEADSLPVPDWLEQKPPDEPDEIVSAPPFSEVTAEDSQITDDQIVPPFVDDVSAPSALIASEEDPAASTAPAEFLDPVSEQPPAPTPPVTDEVDEHAPAVEEQEVMPSESMEEIPGLEEVDEPIDEHLLPPWAREKGFAEEPTTGRETVPEPLPITSKGPALLDAVVEDTEQEPLPTEEPELPPGEPEEGFRYRVVVNGDKLTFPKNVCAHCLRMPVSLAANVRGTLPDPEQPGMRKPLTFKLPLCRACELRAKASTDEERSAKVQAHIISGIVAAFLIVIALIAGIARFDPNAFEGIMVLLIVGVLGYGVPAVFLLNRASSYPPPYDAAYVFTTLRVADDAGDESTAFEWRNQGYAELFRQVNRRNAEDAINQVEDLMMIIEPEVVEIPEESETEVTEQEFEEMLEEAKPSITETEETSEDPEPGMFEALEDSFKETLLPKDGSDDLPETQSEETEI